MALTDISRIAAMPIRYNKKWKVNSAYLHCSTVCPYFVFVLCIIFNNFISQLKIIVSSMMFAIIPRSPFSAEWDSLC